MIVVSGVSHTERFLTCLMPLAPNGTVGLYQVDGVWEVAKLIPALPKLLDVAGPRSSKCFT